MRACLLLAALTGTTALGSGPGADASVKRQPLELPRAVIDVRVGGVFPSFFNDLDSTFTVHAGGAWQFAFDRMLGVFADLSYAEPTAEGARIDPRLLTDQGAEEWSLSVRDFSIAVGPRVQFHLGALLDGYVGLGALVSFTRSITTAQAGEVALGSHTEFSSRFGGVLRLGVGFEVGPGSVVLELAGAHVPVDHLITGDANTSHLSAQLGYALLLR